MYADAPFWDALAEGYAAKPVDDPAAFDRKIAATRSLLTPDSTVLDVGCGTGSLALILAPDAQHVHGLDVSGEMVRIARSKAANTQTSNVTFHQGTLDTVDFAAGSLDGVCAYSILHLVEDRSATLAQLFDMLAPGGFFVSSTVALNDAAWWIPYRPMLAIMQWLGKAPSLGFVSQSELVREFEAAGFVDIRPTDVGAKPEISFIVARKPSA